MLCNVKTVFRTCCWQQPPFPWWPIGTASKRLMSWKRKVRIESPPQRGKVRVAYTWTIYLVVSIWRRWGRRLWSSIEERDKCVNTGSHSVFWLELRCYLTRRTRSGVGDAYYFECWRCSNERINAVFHLAFCLSRRVFVARNRMVADLEVGIADSIIEKVPLIRWVL